MAKNTNKSSSVEHGVSKPVKEIQQFTKEQQKAAWAKQVSDALRLIDLENIPSKTYTIYSKELLRTYLKNPLSDSNSKNLRKLSQFLYVLSPQYRRIIAYFASMIDVKLYNVIPNVDMVEDNDDEKILQNYQEVLRWLEKMNLDILIFSLLITCWREDVFYGYHYVEDSSEQDINSFVILPLDPDYCRISSINYNGCLNCAFDFSFFDSSSNAIYLEMWDKEFTTKYNAYKKDNKLRWQELDPERTWVLKVNYDQTDRVIPPLSGLLEDVINLIDLKGITSVKDEMSIYKLLVAKIDTISGTEEPNDWAIDLNTAVDFYNKMVSQLPDYVGAILSPMTIEPVTFDQSATDESNSISKASSNLFESAGVSQVMDATKLTGATAVTAALRFDGLYALKPLLAQIEARVNMFLDYILPDNGMRVKYLPVTPYFKDEAIKQTTEACTLGLPMKTQLATLMGMSPLDMNAMLHLENNILKLQDKLVPMQSTYTQSGSAEGGGQEKDLDDMTDSGIETKDKEKNKK